MVPTKINQFIDLSRIASSSFFRLIINNASSANGETCERTHDLQIGHNVR